MVVPDESRASGDSARVEELREKLLRDFTVRLTFTVLGAAVLLTAFTDQGWSILLTWSFPVLTLAAPWVYRRTGSMTAAANFLNFPMSILSVLGVVITGGFEGMTPAVFITGPLIALVLAGKRLALMWVLLSAAFMGSIAVWDAVWPFGPMVLDPQTILYINWGICLSILWATFDLATRYDDLRRIVQDDLAESNARLAGLLGELESAATRLEAGAQRLRGDDSGEGLLIRLRRTASEGRSALLENRSGLAELIAQVGVVSDTVAAFHDNAQAVADLLGSIQRISGRLDLMALNMGIEASKAGEAGAPFSILARDMRRLAERVRDDSMRIRSKIHELEQRSADAVDASAAGEALRQRGASNADAIATTFDDVCAMVEEAADAGLGLSGDTLGHLAQLQRGIRATFGHGV